MFPSQFIMPISLCPCGFQTALNCHFRTTCLFQTLVIVLVTRIVQRLKVSTIEIDKLIFLSFRQD